MIGCQRINSFSCGTNLEDYDVFGILSAKKVNNIQLIGTETVELSVQEKEVTDSSVMEKYYMKDRGNR